MAHANITQKKTKLSSHTKSVSIRKPGTLKGKIKTTKDFDKTPKSMIDSFYK